MNPFVPRARLLAELARRIPCLRVVVEGAMIVAKLEN